MSNEYKYPLYKNIKILPYGYSPFVYSRLNIPGHDEYNLFCISRNNDLTNFEYKQAFGPSISADLSGIVFSQDFNTHRHSAKNSLSLDNSSYTAKFAWGDRDVARFFVNSEHSFALTNTNGEDPMGFELKVVFSEAFISIKEYQVRKSAGFFIAQNGEIFFAKLDETGYKVLEKKSTNLKLPSKINRVQKLRKINKYITQTTVLAPLDLTNNGKENIGSGIIALASYDKGELYRSNINQKFDKEGYAIFDNGDRDIKIGYLIEKNGKRSFVGPRFYQFFDGADLNTYIENLDNNKANGYVCHKSSTTYNDLYISYHNNGEKQGVGFDVYQYDYIDITCMINGKCEHFYRIKYNDSSIIDLINDVTYPNPFLFKDDEIEEINEEEINEEEINEEQLVNEEEVKGLIDEYFDKNEIEDTKDSSADLGEEVKETKEKGTSLYSSIVNALLSFVLMLFFPFKWMFNKVKDFFHFLKKKFKKKPRGRYYSNPIKDFFEFIWEKISIFFGVIFSSLASFFKMIGKWILVGLSGLLTGILFIPRIILKILSNIVGGVKEVTSASVTTFAAPLISGIFLILVMCNCIIPMNNWFSNLVSQDIFSWMGLHLCTLFLNAVGVNFFSVIGVIIIFFIDLIYNLLLIVLEIIMCLLYCLVFFVGVYGVGVVALVLIILSYVFVAKSKGTALGVTISALVSIGLLIPYYILLINLWNSVG